jgi:uncharacterized protein YkwD
MPRLFSLACTFAAVAVAVAVAALAIAQPVLAYTDPMICLVNRQRAAHGVRPVGFNQGLQNTAAWLAADMAANGYVGHIGRLVLL